MPSVAASKMRLEMANHLFSLKMLKRESESSGFLGSATVSDVEKEFGHPNDVLEVDRPTQNHLDRKQEKREKNKTLNLICDRCQLFVKAFENGFREKSGSSHEVGDHSQNPGGLTK